MPSRLVIFLASGLSDFFTSWLSGLAASTVSFLECSFPDFLIFFCFVLSDTSQAVAPVMRVHTDCTHESAPRRVQDLTREESYTGVKLFQEESGRILKSSQDIHLSTFGGLLVKTRRLDAR